MISFILMFEQGVSFRPFIWLLATVLVVLTGLMYLPVWILFRLDSPDRTSCVSCLSLNSGNGTQLVWLVSESIFNTSSAIVGNPRCVSICPFGQTCLTANEISFCGASECLRKQTLPGVRPIPFWMQLCSAIYSIIISIGISMLKEFLWHPLFRKCQAKVAPETQQQQHTDFINSPTTTVLDNATKMKLFILEAVGASNRFMFAILFLFAIFNFISINVDAFTSMVFTSNWQRYQAVYALWLNSSTVQLLLIYFCNVFVHVSFKQFIVIPSTEELKTDQESIELAAQTLLFPLSDSTRPANAFWANLVHLILLPLPLLPVLFTHIIPMMVVFFPITLLFVMMFPVLASGALFLVNRVNVRKNVTGLAVLLVYTRLAGMFLVCCFVQAMMTYGIFFYGGMRWDKVVATEFMNRDEVCYANALLNDMFLYKLSLAALILG